MINDTTQAKEFIFGTAYRGSVLGLSRISQLLARLGNPQSALKFIHIAGTNGKGSCAAMISSILIADGRKTGLFTSPYIDCFTEMIQIDHEPLGDSDLISLANMMQPHLDAMDDKPTEFEILVALAFLHFYHQGCDIVVLEVGMGGRMDATNVIGPPLVAVITNIGMDHMEYLGNTIEKIAMEKAGIIKPGTVACVCHPQIKSVETVIRTKCLEHGVNVVFVDTAFIEMELPLPGKHQQINATVVMMIMIALNNLGWNITDRSFTRGLLSTKWPGRFEILRKDPVFIIDGAHNAQSIKTTADTLAQLYPGKKVIFVVGVLADKEYEIIIKTIMPLAAQFITVPPDSPRALAAGDLAQYVNNNGGVAASAYNSIEQGVQAALAAAGADDIICAVGSLYIISKTRKFFKSE